MHLDVPAPLPPCNQLHVLTGPDGGMELHVRSLIPPPIGPAAGGPTSPIGPSAGGPTNTMP